MEGGGGEGGGSKIPFLGLSQFFKTEFYLRIDFSIQFISKQLLALLKV